ncbi:unnamed protein product [Staurois parvus]|uniref:Secreted protein n=1 Tax=Staurois parvus TaxID=386267 RepID=A0ABN9D6M4_9NEOB|nr:unnamed protein product [Staurois parvus]
MLGYEAIFYHCLLVLPAQCLTSLAVFPSVARGKISVPKAVTPSYTRAYHAALLRESLQHLLCPSLPRCVPCSILGYLLRPMPASGFRVSVPVTSGRMGAGTSGKFEIF